LKQVKNLSRLAKFMFGFKFKSDSAEFIF
jgi:hypothetical protein